MAKKRIEVQSVKAIEQDAEFDKERILCTFCYFFQQYTYKQAEKLPYKRVKKMLKIALEQKNTDFIRLTQIVAAPHDSKGQAVSTLLRHFKEQIDE